jgi:hypothetical protein
MAAIAAVVQVVRLTGRENSRSRDESSCAFKGSITLTNSYLSLPSTESLLYLIALVLLSAAATARKTLQMSV